MLISFDQKEYEKLDDNSYRLEKRRLQIELLKLQEDVIKNNRKVCIVFEGRDTAGKSPAGLNPLSVKVMSEVGIDISAQSSDPISKFDLTTFNFCVTVCSDADKHCPILSPRIKKMHWPLEDPAAFDGSLDERYSMFRRSRDEIGILVAKFIDSFF